LKLNTQAPVPQGCDYEVLVKVHAASLNYRFDYSKGYVCIMLC
jgi:hypothetical protein